MVELVEYLSHNAFMFSLAALGNLILLHSMNPNCCGPVIVVLYHRPHLHTRFDASARFRVFCRTESDFSQPVNVTERNAIDHVNKSQMCKNFTALAVERGIGAEPLSTG